MGSWRPSSEIEGESDMILENRSVLAAAAVLALALVYTIGVSNDTVIISPGFVTDLASIPPQNNWKPRESRMDLTMSSLTPFVRGLTCRWMTR